MPALELFSFAACPYAQRTRMVLIEKGLEFELIEIDLYDRPTWFRDVSPYGRVPLLRHEGRVVYESGIINQYLDETFREPPLMPSDAYERAQARIWIDYCETRFLRTLHRLMTERDRAECLADNRAKLTEVLRFMEHEGLRKLGRGPFWMGASPSLVDFQFLPFFERFAVYQELAGAEWPAECSRLSLWFETLAARPSYLETRHTLDFHLEQQRRLSALRAAAATQRPAGT